MLTAASSTPTLSEEVSTTRCGSAIARRLLISWNYFVQRTSKRSKHESLLRQEVGYNTLPNPPSKTTSGREPKLPIRSILSFTMKWWRGFARSSMQLRQISRIGRTVPSSSVKSATATVSISRKKSKSKSPALPARKPGRFSNRS